MAKIGEKIVKAGEEITFKYKHAEHFKTIYANGVWGGPNPHGEIVMNFFLERNQPPEETKHVIAEDRTLVEKSRVPSKDVLIRELQVGIILSLSVARSVKEWLDQKITLLESSLEEAKRGGNGK